MSEDIPHPSARAANSRRPVAMVWTRGSVRPLLAPCVGPHPEHHTRADPTSQRAPDSGAPSDRRSVTHPGIHPAGALRTPHKVLVGHGEAGQLSAVHFSTRADNC
jgi:hypothetical protein